MMLGLLAAHANKPSKSTALGATPFDLSPSQQCFAFASVSCVPLSSDLRPHLAFQLIEAAEPCNSSHLGCTLLAMYTVLKHCCIHLLDYLWDC